MSYHTKKGSFWGKERKPERICKCKLRRVPLPVCSKCSSCQVHDCYPSSLMWLKMIPNIVHIIKVMLLRNTQTNQDSTMIPRSLASITFMRRRSVLWVENQSTIRRMPQQHHDHLSLCNIWQADKDGFVKSICPIPSSYCHKSIHWSSFLLINTLTHMTILVSTNKIRKWGCV